MEEALSGRCRTSAISRSRISASLNEANVEEFSSTAQLLIDYRNAFTEDRLNLTAVKTTMGASVFETFVNWKNGIKQQLSRPSFKEASKEVAITVGTATLPIWFFPLMGLILFSPTRSFHLLEDSVSNGELFLFSTSLVGPLIYILFRVYDPRETSFKAKYRTSLVFPNNLLFAVIIFLICITAAAVFGLQKISPDFSASAISKPGYITLSAMMFIVATGSLLVATKSRNELVGDSPPQQMREEEDDFAARYKSGATDDN